MQVDNGLAVALLANEARDAAGTELAAGATMLVDHGGARHRRPSSQQPRSPTWRTVAVRSGSCDRRDAPAHADARRDPSGTRRAGRAVSRIAVRAGRWRWCCEPARRAGASSRSRCRTTRARAARRSRASRAGRCAPHATWRRCSGDFRPGRHGQGSGVGSRQDAPLPAVHAASGRRAGRRRAARCHLGDAGDARRAARGGARRAAARVAPGVRRGRGSTGGRPRRAIGGRVRGHRARADHRRRHAAGAARRSARGPSRAVQRRRRAGPRARRRLLGDRAAPGAPARGVRRADEQSADAGRSARAPGGAGPALVGAARAARRRRGHRCPWVAEECPRSRFARALAGLDWRRSSRRRTAGARGA